MHSNMVQCGQLSTTYCQNQRQWTHFFFVSLLLFKSFLSSISILLSFFLFLDLVKKEQCDVTTVTGLSHISWSQSQPQHHVTHQKGDIIYHMR